jgi:hypothetical protein
MSDANDPVGDRTEKAVPKSNTKRMRVDIDLDALNMKRRVLADRIVVTSCCLFGALYFSALAWVFVRSPTENYLLVKLFFGQFPALVGLPAAAAMAFFVIWVFEASKGKMEISFGEHRKFSGASTPTFFWAVVFLSIGYMINVNWISN